MAYKEVSDQQLWDACRRDDMQAYSELFRRYDPKFRQLATRYLKDTMQAEEVAMDMLCNLWMKRKQIVITGDISNYFFRCMRNLLVNQLKKKLPQFTDLETITPEAQFGRPADYGLLKMEAEHSYQQALERLSAQRRKVFILSREKNLSYNEIAREMGLSVNTVERHMVSALSFMRTALKESILPSVILVLLFLPLLFAQK